MHVYMCLYVSLCVIHIISSGEASFFLCMLTVIKISLLTGLDHSVTAPAGGMGTHKRLLVDKHDIIMSKSKSQIESRRHDLKLDRLSQREKVK